jgi:hypothetical protein
VREKYCWLVADKPSEQAVNLDNLANLVFLKKEIKKEFIATV